jgi:hypothetical protein
LTVSTIANRTTQMACNGSIQNFVFSFPIIETSDLEVILTDADGVDTILTETTDYIVSSVNDDYSDGGIVTTIATYTTGNTITIVRNVPLLQESDFTEGMPTLYETFEDGLDRLTMITQQLSDEHSRALTAPLSEPSTTDFTLPTQTDRANKYLAFDADGEPVVTSGTGESAVISTFAETLLDDTTAAGMRATLELGTASTLDIDTDGTLATNSDTVIASQKATKTYVDTKIPSSYLDKDGTLAANSDTKVATQKATKTYVDAKNIVVQTASAIVTASATGSTVIPLDNSIPQKTDGDEYLTLNFVPTNASNKLHIDAALVLSNDASATNTYIAALFKGTDSDALSVGVGSAYGSGAIGTAVLHHEMTAGTTNQITFKVRGGCSNSGTTTLNGAAGSGLFGGVGTSFIKITEIKV